VRWDADGNFDIGFPSTTAIAAPPNLAFEDDHMVVEVGFEGHRLIFGLDTGAGHSILYVPFRKQFAALVNASGKEEKHSGGGASGMIEYDAIVLPQVKLHASGFETVLQPAELTLKEDFGQRASRQFRAGSPQPGARGDDRLPDHEAHAGGATPGCGSVDTVCHSTVAL
jgi:hypothetical protein